MLMKNRSLDSTTPEDGFAALVIAIVLVLVLSLITVGFAELMRHEERSALDKQLSSQAYYAAETGVNDATKAINNGYLGAKTDCLPGEGLDANYAANAAGLTDPTSNLVAPDATHNPTGASYPCLLINPAPPTLYYNPISANSSRTAEFTAVDPDDGSVAAVSSIKISWQDSGSNTSFLTDSQGCSGNFKPSSNWPHIGVLRAQLIPLSAATGYQRDDLANSAFTAFLCPSKSSTDNTAAYTASIGPTKAGLLLNGDCDTSHKPAHCNVTINNLPANQSTFFINLRSIYSPTAVTISAYTNNGSKQLNLKGAQTLIDSTGKAQDVLRRIQVRVPTNNAYDIPDGTHADICKQYDLTPDSTTSAQSECSTNLLSQ